MIVEDKYYKFDIKTKAIKIGWNKFTDLNWNGLENIIYFNYIGNLICPLYPTHSWIIAFFITLLINMHAYFITISQ